MQRRIGEVWFLPPELEEGGDIKPRRHVVLTSIDDERDGVCAYATTRTTESRFGARSMYVDPAKTPGCGFTKPTYVYPGRLVPAALDDLMRMTGRLEQVEQLRSVLRAALGLGTGAAPERSLSCRGRVIRFTPAFHEKIGYQFGVVLTEHTYSENHRYQIIVPVADLARYKPMEGDMVITDGTWFRDVSPTVKGAILSVDEIHSVFHRDHIDGCTDAVMDEPSLQALEAAVIAFFEL